jgi:DNA (cytosine-5)-methyltransferase 1
MIKVLELFSGYGGASFALKKAGIEHKTIGYSDIEKSANYIYALNHGVDIPQLGDVTKINPEQLEDFDLLTGGFPCQSFSIAGKREGFASEKTGNLFFEITRIADAKKPRYMLLENVKGILNHDDGETHKRVIRELNKIGYAVLWKCLNSRQHGIPQNRERVWYVCKHGGWDFMEFTFPEPHELKITVADLLEQYVDAKYYLTEKQIDNIMKYNTKHENNNNGFRVKPQQNISKTLHHHASKDYMSIPIIGDFRYDEGFRPRQSGTRPTLNTSSDVIIHCTQTRSPDRPSLQNNPNAGGSGHLSKNDGTVFCLDTWNSQAVELNKQWRRLTPRECFRLMGFMNDEIQFGDLSDNKLYALAGNGWDINVASKIMKRLFK